MTNNNIDGQIAKQIRQLNLHKKPQRDLWIGIDKAISAENVTSTINDNKSHRAANKPMLAVAASLVLISFVAWFSFESGKSLRGTDLVASLSKQHQAQKQTLLIRFKDQAATTENWQQQLDDLDEAAEAIKKALRAQPDNRSLLMMLKHIYEQQMSLIERVHAPVWKRV